MVLDIIVAVIFILSAIQGKVRGFGDSALRLLGLAASCVLGTLGTRPVSNFLFATPFDEGIVERLIALNGSEELDLMAFIPKVLRRVLEQLGQTSLEIDVRHFTTVLIMILSFLLIVLAVSIVAVSLRRRLARHRREGTVIGTVDSSIGLLFGMVKGLILVCLFLALIFPACGIFAPEKIQVLNDNLEHSLIAGTLYHWNPLLVFIRRLPL
ncbi:MAG: CvpA family protein [Mogibacterium sp.]|nr:CvpA family protein [Mogibacterium sp.]